MSYIIDLQDKDHFPDRVEDIVFPQPDLVWKKMEKNYIKALARGDSEALKISRSHFATMPIPKQYQKTERHHR